MKPVHERNRECLPPKKRDLPQNYDSTVKTSSSSANSSTPGEASDLSRALLIATGPSEVGLRYSVPSENYEELTSVTSHQYGCLYNVAVSPANISPAVVSMSSLPPPFTVASPVIQHPAIPFPPIHCAPVSPTSVQYIGSPYSVPCVVPSSFLCSSLMSSSVNLATTDVPHYVPYGSLITERTTVTASQNPSGSTFKKGQCTSLIPTSLPSHLQSHAGTLPVDVAQSRVPIFYHHSSCVPAVYSVHDVPLTCSGSDPAPAAQNMREREDFATISTNGELRELECNQERMINQAMDLHSQLNDVELHSAAGEHISEGQLLSDYQPQRSEVTVPAHRSTPDADLEVQRVVSGLNSQKYHTALAEKDNALNPTNLSCIIAEHQDEFSNVSSSPVQRNLPEVAVKQGQLHSLYMASSLPEIAHKHLKQTMTMSNGESVHLPLGSEQGFVSDISGIKVLEAPAEGDCVVENSFVFATSSMQSVLVQSPNPSPMPPSHFMKGAIIQLATGELKRVEDLQTQDFVQSAEVSGGLKIDSSTVMDIQDSRSPGLVTLHFIVGEQQSKVSLDVPPEHPFFVYGQGWSSCSPGQTTEVFALPCHRLQVGDVCISISLQSLSENSAPSQSPSPKDRTQQMILTEKERNSLSQRGTVHFSSHVEPLQSETSGHNCWSTPGFQRYSLQAKDTWPSLHRPTFIPQEVKLSIEGRSNAGK